MGMFNFDNLFKDINGMNVQLNQVDLGAAQAKLILFTPKVIPTQVLRPWKYNFNEQLVNDIGGYSSFREAVAPRGGGLTKESINMAILPDTTGVQLDTNTFSQQWSFVLIIDDANPSVGIRNAVSGPKTRIIATGYVVDEPINRTTMWSSTPTINPNAVLIFTHTSILYTVGQMGGVHGYQTREHISHDADHVSELNQQIANRDLFIMTPQDLRNATEMTYGAIPSENAMIGAYGSIALGNAKINDASRKIQNTLKSPKHHLGTIMASADSAIASMQDDPISSTITPDILNDPHQAFNDRFKESCVGSFHVLPKHGLNTDVPITLGNLQMQYPTIQVQPFEIPTTGTWGVTPQTVMAKKTVMSSLISATLSALVPGSGLSNIGFRYSSWYKQNSFEAQTSGLWEIQQFGTLADANIKGQESSLNTFRQVVETQLFPILRAFGGEFDLMAFVNITGETLIDLNYCDERSNVAGEGYYETTNRLGGMINPNVATGDIVNNNAYELERLVNQISLGEFGKSPIMDTTNYNNAGIFSNNVNPNAPLVQPQHNNNNGGNNGSSSGPGYYI